MVVNYERIAAFICPFCSKITKRKINAFDFSGRGEKRLHCATLGCREECAKISLLGKKYKIEAECPLCGDVHVFSTSAEKFWNKPLMCYKCSMTNSNMMFVGDEAEVDRSFEEDSKYYSEILRDMDNNAGKSQILYEMLDCIHRLHSLNMISCVCNSEYIKIDIADNNVVLTCEECNRTRVIEATEHNLAMLLNAEAIIIGN